MNIIGKLRLLQALICDLRGRGGEIAPVEIRVKI